MPNVIKTKDGGWEYKCECGQEMILYTAEKNPPKKLVRCIDCIAKEDKRRNKKQESE